MRDTYLTCAKCGVQVNVMVNDTPGGYEAALQRVGWVVVEDSLLCIDCRPTTSEQGGLCDMCGINPVTTAVTFKKAFGEERLCDECISVIHREHFPDLAE